MKHYSTIDMSYRSERMGKARRYFEIYEDLFRQDSNNFFTYISNPDIRIELDHDSIHISRLIKTENKSGMRNLEILLNEIANEVMANQDGWKTEQLSQGMFNGAKIQLYNSGTFSESAKAAIVLLETYTSLETMFSYCGGFTSSKIDQETIQKGVKRTAKRFTHERRKSRRKTL